MTFSRLPLLSVAKQNWCAHGLPAPAGYTAVLVEPADGERAQCKMRSRGISGYLGAARAISGHLVAFRLISGHLGASRGISADLGASRLISGYLGVSRLISGYLAALGVFAVVIDLHAFPEYDFGVREIGRDYPRRPEIACETPTAPHHPLRARLANCISRPSLDHLSSTPRTHLGHLGHISPRLCGACVEAACLHGCCRVNR